MAKNSDKPNEPENDPELDDDSSSEDDSELEDESEELEEEFSLDQLSQAYAEVLKGHSGEAENVEPESASNDEHPADSDVDAPEESNDLIAAPISPASIIESILFVGTPKDVKLNSRKIAAILRDVSPKEVTKTVKELNKRYEKENSAYRIQIDGGVFKMILDPQLLEFQQEFFGRNREVRLGQSVIDVMAVVAYNQPVTRDQVDKIRGKSSGSVLNQLVRRELLYVEPGDSNPKIKYYSTTDRFLDLFNLEELADLPQSHEVSDIEELAD